MTEPKPRPRRRGNRTSPKRLLIAADVLSAIAALFFWPYSGLAQSNPATTAPPSLDLSDYVVELDRWRDAVVEAQQDPAEAAALRKQLPEYWWVSVDGDRVAVSTAWLRKELEAIEKGPGSRATREQIQQRLQTLRDEAVRLAGLPTATPSPAEARQKIDEILKRKEFRGVRGPTWWDVLRERIALWLIDLIRRLFGITGVSAQTSRVLVWILIGASGLLLAIWLVHRLMRREEPVKLAIGESRLAAKSWQERASEALAAAECGNFRDAIRLAYWAGVYRLEELGLWKTDRTRTHREYLKLLPPAHPERETFADITRRFELVWYAGRQSSAPDFEVVVKNLEKLGCVFPSKLATEHL